MHARMERSDGIFRILNDMYLENIWKLPKSGIKCCITYEDCGPEKDLLFSE